MALTRTEPGGAELGLRNLLPREPLDRVEMNTSGDVHGGESSAVEGSWIRTAKLGGEVNASGWPEPGMAASESVTGPRTRTDPVGALRKRWAGGAG